MPERTSGARLVPVTGEAVSYNEETFCAALRLAAQRNDQPVDDALFKALYQGTVETAKRDGASVQEYLRMSVAYLMREIEERHLMAFVRDLQDRTRRDELRKAGLVLPPAGPVHRRGKGRRP